ncbi:NUDIX domain-containing protein [Lactiplantibacillus sp. WILCCON 0030]|uniref:NUDIX domain-containing protein n=1 Tax=Lactiplantibacillus brownii TaxID=3069269 RepID=A0ABU1AC13_9LACO|nr:NUDIX domain-containing protein [Lactiplantibacillus brownii]MDQ7937865.1 NUDIX domain-containing protein [Lactiplantibacillus brownii]
MRDQQVVNRPLISITNVIWSFDQTTQQLLVLLLQRSQAPFKGTWGLPTTYLRTAESAEAASLRLVREKLGLSLPTFHTEQLATFTNTRRGPGERELALTYMVYLPSQPTLVPGYGAQAVDWFAVVPDANGYNLAGHGLTFQGLPETIDATTYYQNQQPYVTANGLTADHTLILRTALLRVRNRLDYAPTILLVLGDQFTLKQARELYAILLRKPLSAIDNSNFRKTHVHLFNEIGLVHQRASGRPAKVYRLKTDS